MPNNPRVHGILLLGGSGSRLRPAYTGNKHLIPIGGRPMAEYGLELFSRCYIETVTAVVRLRGLSVRPIRAREMFLPVTPAESPPRSRPSQRFGTHRRKRPDLFGSIVGAAERHQNSIHGNRSRRSRRRLQRSTRQPEPSCPGTQLAKIIHQSAGAGARISESWPTGHVVAKHSEIWPRVMRTYRPLLAPGRARTAADTWAAARNLRGSLERCMDDEQPTDAGVTGMDCRHRRNL